MPELPSLGFALSIPAPPSFRRPLTSSSGPAEPKEGVITEERTLIVGRGIRLRGTVYDVDRLVVEGTVQSELIQARDLEIAEGGVLKATTQVERIVVSGAFEGDLTATRELVVARTGQLTGTARYGRLVVEEGGKIVGCLEAR